MKTKTPSVLLIFNNTSDAYSYLCNTVVNTIKEKFSYWKLTIINYDEQIIKDENWDKLLDGINCVLSYFHIPKLREYCENKNICIIPNPFYWSICSDKWEVYKFMRDNDINTAKTINLNNDDDLKNQFEQSKKVLGIPFVLKYRWGWGGKDVFLINSLDDFENALNQTKTFTDYICQKYLEESYGFDYRVLMCGSKILNIIKRHNKNSFKSNISSGGSLEKVGFLKKIKIKSFIKKQNIAKKVKIDFSGLDILENKKEFFVCEINVNPGISYGDKLAKKYAYLFLKKCEEIFYNNYN